MGETAHVLWRYRNTFRQCLFVLQNEAGKCLLDFLAFRKKNADISQRKITFLAISRAKNRIRSMWHDSFL